MLLVLPFTAEVSDADTGTREADEAYFDSTQNAFILKFSSGLSGKYTCTVVSASGTVIHETSVIEFSGQRVIGLIVDEGAEVSPGDYHADLVGSGDHVFQTIHVNSSSGDGGSDSSINVPAVVSIAVVAAAAAAAGVILFLRKR